jgi:hypothetical protein
MPPVEVEICNGVDDDCNGVADEGFDVGVMCSAGVGECKVMGVIVCDGMGEAQCSASPSDPSMEVCDLKDNDCDGIVDNRPVGGDVSDGCDTIYYNGCICMARPTPAERDDAWKIGVALVTGLALVRRRNSRAPAPEHAAE